LAKHPGRRLEAHDVGLLRRAHKLRDGDLASGAVDEEAKNGTARVADGKSTTRGSSYLDVRGVSVDTADGERPRQCDRQGPLFESFRSHGCILAAHIIGAAG
jgi:hypothetical protein